MMEKKYRSPPKKKEWFFSWWRRNFFMRAQSLGAIVHRCECLFYVFVSRIHKMAECFSNSHPWVSPLLGILCKKKVVYTLTGETLYRFWISEQKEPQTTTAGRAEAAAVEIFFYDYIIFFIFFCILKQSHGFSEFPRWLFFTVHPYGDCTKSLRFYRKAVLVWNWNLLLAEHFLLMWKLFL